MYTKNQIILLAAAHLMTQAHEGSGSLQLADRMEKARLLKVMQAWLDKNGIELFYVSYGYYRVTKEQFASVESKELTPLPFILFDK